MFLDDIERRRPRMLFGYPSALDVIARHAETQGRDMSSLGIKVAFVTSEMLYREQRETISRVFGCPVANGYGGRDAGFIAHECPQGGMHVTAEDVIIEVLDEDGRPVQHGEAGELVVTHLRSYGFPFIRYRTGDLVRLGDTACPCGRGLPVLADIQGRSTDMVRLPDGTRMHGLALIYVLRDLPGIERFKIEQEAVNLIRVRIVPGRGMDPGVPGIVRQGLERRLGSAVTVTVEVVDQIPPERSGKYRYVVSRVA
jgi:phenylacetate-CoA ligase